MKLSGFGSKRFKSLVDAENACRLNDIELVPRKRKQMELSMKSSNKCMKKPAGQSSQESTGQFTGASNVLITMVRLLILLRGRSTEFSDAIQWVMAMPGLLGQFSTASWALLLSNVAWICLDIIYQILLIIWYNLYIVCTIFVPILYLIGWYRLGSFGFDDGLQMFAIYHM